MESCTRWLVAAISLGSSSTVRGVATCPAVSSGHVGRVQTKCAVSSLRWHWDVAAKTEVEAALERAREEKKAAQSNQQARWSPDAILERARCKVRRFE